MTKEQSIINLLALTIRGTTNLATIFVSFRNRGLLTEEEIEMLDEVIELAVQQKDELIQLQLGYGD